MLKCAVICTCRLKIITSVLPISQSITNSITNMSINVVFIYDRKKKADDRTAGMIEIRVTAGKVQRYVSTGVKVLPSQWHKNRVIDRPDSGTLNDRLSIMSRKINKYINACIEADTAIDLTQLKEIAKIDDTEATFIDFICERADLRPVKESTRQRYEVFINNFTLYGRIRKFSDITVKAIKDYNEWLHQIRIDKDPEDPDSVGRPLSDATIYNYHKSLKLFINDAYTAGKVPENPYNRLRGFISRGEKQVIDYLTAEEMQRIENSKLSTRTLRRARDLFVFQMYTGLSYSDLLDFDFSDYQQIDGKWVNTGTRHKTGVRFVNQLLSPALRILERYSFKLPVMDNANYNKFLKTVAAECGIQKRLHSHLARSTFATYMLSQGCSVPNVSRMLGHTNLRQTMKYAEILENDVRSDFDMIEEKIQSRDER